MAYRREFGQKTLGPRPELVEEFQRISQVPLFYMYQADQFLRHAKDRLAAKVSDESIEQVRVTATTAGLSTSEIQAFGMQADQAVEAWLEQAGFDHIRYQRFGPFDFTVSVDGKPDHAYDIMTVRSPKMSMLRLKDRIHRGFFELSRNEIGRLSIVLVAMGEDDAKNSLSTLHSRQLEIPEQIEVLVGWVDEEFGSPMFRIIGKIDPNMPHRPA